jgi:hypothetical protein
VAVVVDTSGSIRPEELDRFAAEVSAILELFPSRLHLIYADMAVTGYHVLESRDFWFAVRPAGGGGTDFRPAFVFLDQRFVTPACLLYLTDMECRLFPEKPPGYPVLWVNTGTGETVPPFGEVIRLPFRTSGEYPEVSASFAALRTAYEEIVKAVHAQPPIARQGEMGIRPSTRETIAAAVTARRMLAFCSPTS